MLGLIWAQTIDGVIGRGNTLPWSLPEDLAHFRRITAGGRVYMGRNTWDSLPERFRPLPDRENVVLSRTNGWTAPGAEVTTELPNDANGWVIGGAQLYRDTITRADRLSVTYIDADIAGDVYAPQIPDSFRERSTEDWQKSTSGLRYRFAEFERRA